MTLEEYSHTDYCDVYLSHNAPRVRRDHISGWRHALQVRAYYNIVANQDRMLRAMGELARDYDAAGEPMPVPLPVNMQPPPSAKLPVDVMAAAGMAPRHFAVVHELPSLRRSDLRASKTKKDAKTRPPVRARDEPRTYVPPESCISGRSRSPDSRRDNRPSAPFGHRSHTPGFRRGDSHQGPQEHGRPQHFRQHRNDRRDDRTLPFSRQW